MTITLEDAIGLACAAHAGQKDKAGEPYILHPLRVMLAMRTDEDRIVAVLHDVLEDRPDYVRILPEAGVPPEAIATLEVLTRRPGESYDAYIERVCTNEQARRVKWADLADNLDGRRLSRLDAGTHGRLFARYNWALRRLMNCREARS